MASHSRPKTESALPAITTSDPSAVGYTFDGDTPGSVLPERAAQHAAQLEIGHRRLHERRHRLVDRHVDLLAPAGAPGLGEGGQRPDHAEHGGEGVAQADAGARRRPVGAAGRVADAADGLADAAEPGLAGARAGLAEARDVDEHDRRVGLGQHVVAEPPLVEPARPEVLDHDVARRRQPPHHGAGPLVAQVERDRPLVAPDGRPPQAVTVAGDAPAPHRVALAGRLDLDDLGAVVAEQLAGERPGDETAQLQHPHAGQRPLPVTARIVTHSHAAWCRDSGRRHPSRGPTDRSVGCIRCRRQH